ncbi:translation initiation factor SUI1-like protein [Klebsiella pneumoniae]|nr:translation initiation factor SUI1-like protein [Klebsiella pneumoniae]
MSDSNSRLVYSTETGRIDEAKPAPVRPERRRHCADPAPDQRPQGQRRLSD